MVIIYQGSLAKYHAPGTIHFGVYFKQLWKEEFMQIWLDYCLINSFGRPKKLYSNDQFGEIIIKLYKKKVRPLSNAKSDKFL